MKLRTLSRLTAVVSAGFFASAAWAADVEGFAEPSREIQVAAADAGILERISVKEGDRVARGQVLGNLDQLVLRATLDIADKTRLSRGRLNSAQADLRLKSERLVKLRMLLERKTASQEEVDRTAVEKEVAEAQLLAVQEELAIRELEYQRILAQLEQRLLRCPIDGVITRIVKDPGEYVSPSDPVVLTVVQLDPLIVVFSTPSVAAAELTAGREVTMLYGEQKASAKGIVEFVSPVADAQSGTIQVKVKLPNPQNAYRSGEKCLLVLGTAVPAKAADQTAEVDDFVPLRR
jgi:RND family efflux transporter MFP subunit